MSRLIAFAARLLAPPLLLAFFVAVAIGRLAGDPAHRHGAVEPLCGLGALSTRDLGDGFRLLAVDTGRVRRLALPPTDQLDLPSVAPWAEDGQRRQAVGRWRRRTGSDFALMQEFGLIRYDLASNEVLDRHMIDVLPTSPPCWFPDRTARVLFVGGDGAIHRFAFEDASGREVEPSRRRVESLAWDNDWPDARRPQVADLCWPDLPGFERILIVGLNGAGPEATRPTPARPGLWALGLDAPCERVVSATPLEFEDAAFGDSPIRRRPSVGRGADGRFHLACLEQARGDADPRLRLGELELHPGSHPRLRVRRGKLVPAACGPVAPSFSSNGRSVVFVARRSDGSLRVERRWIDPPGPVERPLARWDGPR